MSRRVLGNMAGTHLSQLRCPGKTLIATHLTWGEKNSLKVDMSACQVTAVLVLVLSLITFVILVSNNLEIPSYLSSK